MQVQNCVTSLNVFVYTATCLSVGIHFLICLSLCLSPHLPAQTPLIQNDCPVLNVQNVM